MLRWLILVIKNHEQGQVTNTNQNYYFLPSRDLCSLHSDRASALRSGWILGTCENLNNFTLYQNLKKKQKQKNEKKKKKKKKNRKCKGSKGKEFGSNVERIGHKKGEKQNALTEAMTFVIEDFSTVCSWGVTEALLWLWVDNIDCPSEEMLAACVWDINWYWVESLKLLCIWPFEGANCNKCKLPTQSLKIFNQIK